ncbi:FecR family protein [uncultured Draconibacterium sp.]|uniref:FecR family protein n=1 Tax=uncultured Draconibacterium sp. TaxID=1573823 RepID=UPI0032173FA2
MKNQKPENIEQAILHFIQGNANIDEHTLVLKWLEDHPEDRKKIFSEKDLWNAAGIDSAELKETERKQWQVLQQQIGSTPVKNLRFKEFLRIAAIVIFAIGIGWMSNSLLQNNILNRSVEMKSVESIRGQIKEIFLADGTHVWLNADSKLTFPSNFTAKTRNVELQGEAFFEVTSNEQNPFLVKTKNHTVKVTGTRFNICEYPEDKMIETTLVEGKVKIISGNFFQDLKPGQQSTFYTETAEITIGDKDFDIYTAWKEGRYEFRNESVSKIFKIMERWWDVEIEYSEAELKYEYISGVLRKHKPIKQHFEVINELIPIDYQIDNDNIVVKLK